MAKAKKSFYKILLAVLLLLAASWFVFGKSLFDSRNSNQSVQKITVGQSITGKNTEANFISYQVEIGKTALDLLRENAEVQTKCEGINAYVTQINGYPDLRRMSLLKEFWAFYINGKMSKVGAGSYKLKDGDKIEWKVEKY